MTTSPLRVGIIGPAGFSGSYLTVELLNRGHTVIGISRAPEKIGTHARYIPRPFDIDSGDFQGLSKLLDDMDVLVSAYGPHTAGAEALVYMPYIEAVRTMILAVKHSAKQPYFLFIGGAGSLHIPSTLTPCSDHPAFYLSYRRAIALSEAHIQYMEDRLGIIGDSIRTYRNARIAENDGKGTEETVRVISKFEDGVKRKDKASDFIRAGRTAYTFFDGNTSFQWTFVSPSALYRPGKRTGLYEISIDDMVLVGEEKEGGSVFEGRLTGISVSDMMIAIADEVEGKRMVGKHWSAWGDLSNDEPGRSYLTLEDVGRKD
ncbi:hypothetical protein GQ43DRAFT_456788 [Delitschia confertaspora ATCC 74209]|uniref:NAD-dependent epimerase/dehydratase domain-containing protein n=1 Tax=Delitschia confertaspora ATCC 74209 TaxID=1513339 RepID=A0A9P4JIX9_9PLEO|nr:hypothetical protein GQ43DRAFT_456788 [Delitschia confertaspora ATCC 74209]